jgi:Thioredoxin
MAVTRERFEQGMTYDQYRAQMTRNQERFDANERQLVLDPADLAAFKNLPRPLNVLVLAEDWCGDVIDNLPILGRLARESGKLNVRLFLRDQNADLMDQFLNRGEFRSIPVFAFFDDQFSEIGRFIERPDSVTERRAQRRTEILAQHPELQAVADVPITQMPEDVRAKYMEITAGIRDELKPVDNRDVVQALRQIVERVPAQG